MNTRRRRHDYRAASTPATLRKHETIRRALAISEDGLTVAEVGRVLGMSRQAALYHLKKMAAESQLVMQLEPCASNRGLQFRVWSEMALASRYARLMAHLTPLGMLRAA